jgi:DNA-binding FadR family transcriptional regulator
MAEAYAVSRPVVREALSRLRADGMIVSRHGSGSYVQRKPSKALLSLAPIGGMADLMRCYEFRIALEGEAASLAAARRTNADLKAISDAFQAMSRAVKAGELGAEADIEFHNAIAAATKNKVFESAMDALAAHTLQGITVTRNLSLRIGRRRLETVQAEHKLILEAIREGNPDDARDAMRNHIDNARNRILVESVEPQIF